MSEHRRKFPEQESSDLATPYSECAETVQRLHTAVVGLERAGKVLQLPPLEGREWFELLRQKLMPQLLDDAYLVVAVVGGTNIGKSVIFNHIAGSCVSSTSPLASGTKHPVCLVPPGFMERHDLESIFQGFELHEWTSSKTALENHAEHRLFWKTSEQTPDNLLILDTPDIDSDAPINWHRADIIRRCSDVLFAVLTQQKYNDAAVKQFFRKAADDDKAVIIVFNQCQLPEDEDYWPLWLDTFCRETKIEPEILYISPNDRRAAEENRLPFYERNRSSAAEPSQDAGQDDSREKVSNLTDDLSRLRFSELKLRTLRGSLRHLLDADAGVPEYLREVEHLSSEFLLASQRFSSESVVRIRDWPSIPNTLLVAEIRKWWKTHYEGWARHVHRFYDTVGQGVTWPFRFVKDRMQSEQTHPLEVYRKQEWTILLKAVEEVFEKLSWMSESGNELLQPHFERLLAGKTREDLLDQLRIRHQEVNLDVELEDVVNAEMQSFQTDSPELYKFYKQLNHVSAAVRPMTSVVLFTLGWGPAGEVVAPLIANAAAHTIVPIVADFAGGAVAAVAGETALSGAAAQSTGFLQAKLQRLQTTFTARRAGWLVELLKDQLLGSLPEELQAAAEVPQSEEFQQVVTILNVLTEQLQNTLEIRTA
jgi:hypothetical protein